MAYCGNCGSKIPEGVKYCINCGTKVLIPENEIADKAASGVQQENSNDRLQFKDIPIKNELKKTGIDRFNKFYGVLLLVLSLFDLFSDPPIVTIILSALIIAGCIFCFTKRYKLKAFTIIALILSVLCMVLGIYQASKYGMLKYKKNVDEEKLSADQESETTIEVPEDTGKEVTYGRIVFKVPDKYLDDVTSLSIKEDVYASKNGEAKFDIAWDNGSVQEWQFHNPEARELVTDEMLNQIGQTLYNLTLETSEYDEVAGLDSIIVKCSGSDHGEKVNCSTAYIHDRAGDCSIIVRHFYYDKYADKYASDFDELLESAFIEGTSQSNTQSDSKPVAQSNDTLINDDIIEYCTDKEIELGGKKYEIPSVFEFGVYKYNSTQGTPVPVGERNLFFMTVDLDEETEYLRAYGDKDIDKVKVSLKETALKQFGHMQMGEKTHTKVEEKNGQDDEYVYYLRNFDAGFWGNSALKTITYYTKATDYNNNISMIIYVYDKDEVSNDDTFENTISSAGWNIDFIENDAVDVTDSLDLTHNKTGEVDPSLKAALDDYEAFMDKYVAFMKKYSSNPGNAISMLSDYTDMLSEYTKYVDKIDAYEKKKNEMSKEDLKYFMDVTNRVEKKMLDIM